MLRRIAGGVALGIAGVAAGRLFFRDTTPTLLKGLPSGADARDRGFAARVARQFPTGTPEPMLRQRLAAQGFTVHADRRAEWQRTGLPCKDFAQIEWDAANGQVTATRAVVWQACT
jgi:hypothetical protein